jgi:hypothetical protein
MDSFQGRAGTFFRPTMPEFDARLTDRGLANLDHQCVINSVRSFVGRLILLRQQAHPAGFRSMSLAAGSSIL